MQKTIYLMRHGESESDIENLFGGWYDDKPTQKAKEQARAKAQEMKKQGINFDVVFASPFLRAKEVAEIFAEVYGVPLVVTEKIKERNRYAGFSGTSKDKLKAENPDLHNQILGDPRFTVPGGEEYGDFLKRIKNALGSIWFHDFQNALVVTHAGPLTSILREVFKREPKPEEVADFAYIKISLVLNTDL